VFLFSKAIPGAQVRVFQSAIRHTGYIEMDGRFSDNETGKETYPLKLLDYNNGRFKT
jgi:hypothetical protein